ncbi:LOB domain-containing protein 15 isoform X1 [Spinacia oleracea]|uniref:LOB domain-containing protein 15 isoform X1 n=2 Tax=Spinacia oleracea TaxID=3562 RepID=A0A9R0IL42_SPIOL|nr:LOB domain-containing protein 15 isoform X1 [Spinacia oleracea]
MFRERERFEEDGIGKRIKLEIDAAKSMVASNNCYDNNNNNHHQIIVERRSQMMGVGVGPPSLGSTLNTITPCAACKLLRRRCAEECPFSPYFSPHEPQKFAAVHKVFGASNVSKLLMEVPDNQRADAANSLVYEANVRLRDPVYGCMGAISALQQQVQAIHAELNAVRAEILKYKYREAANTLMSATNPNNNNHPHSHLHHHHNSLVTSVAAAVIAATLPQVQSPPHQQPLSQPQQDTTPPPRPGTPPPPSASVVVSSSPSGAASLYTPPPPPPPDHHSGTTNNNGFTSISTDHNSVSYFD